MYTIVESETRGKIVISTQDLLPGVELVREDPIVYASDEDISSLRYTSRALRTGVESKAWVVYDGYKRLSNEDKKVFMTLFGSPQHFALARTCRQVLSRIPKTELNCDLDEFLEVFTRMAMNDISCSMGYGIYMIGTRWAHSCLPNCCWVSNHPEGKDRLIRTIRPVKAGEELTICYNADFTINPTHERRAKYLRSKEFLCNCEKCTDPADITRRFNCFNKQCNGYHCVCQPLSTDKPYLLACAECGVTPPADWETQMLFLELKTSASIPKGDYRDGFLQHLANLRGKHKAPTGVLAAQEPPLQLHYTAAYFLERNMESAWRFSQPQRVLECAQQLLSLYDKLMSFPNKLHVDILLNASNKLKGTAGGGSVRALQLALRSAQNALRQLIVMDYQCITKETRQSVQDVMYQLRLEHQHNTPTLSDTCCAFCEASPSDMAITLSLCGRCKSVQYCGRECQAAHWKLHKTECKVH